MHLHLFLFEYVGIQRYSGYIDGVCRTDSDVVPCLVYAVSVVVHVV